MIFSEMKYYSLIIIALLIIGCQEKQVEKEIPIRPVKYTMVKKTGVTDNRSFTGTAKSKEEARLSFRVAGTVTNILVKVGDRVQRGQLIATLDPEDYQVALKQVEAMESGSRASQKSAEANYIAAKSSYQRIKKLYENNSVPLSQFEQAKAQYDAAKSNYEAARYSTNASKEQIQSAQNQVSYTKLTAPFSGIISSKHVEENELVNSGAPIITLSSEDDLEVQVGVPEVLISHVVSGMKTKINFSTLPDQMFDGKVVEVGFSPGNSSTYPVTVDLLTDNKDIRPGMPATVIFELSDEDDQRNKLLVPAASVGEDNKGRYVFLLEEQKDNKAIAKKQYVEIEHLHTKGFEVTSGLKEGQLIATAGLNILLEGDLVRLK
jgi:RND family efflux transporter MFP subunit